jgi:hypothetical protein
MATMLKQRIRFHWAILWRYYLCSPLRTPLLLFLSHLSKPRREAGIRILDPLIGNKDEFSQIIAAALALLASSDRRRFGRVQAHIRIIMNLGSVWGFSYDWPLRLCCLELRLWSYPGDPDTTVAFVASLLVNLATVGYLMSRRILRTGANESRFDSLVCREARRFLRRLGWHETPWDPEKLGPIPSGARLKLAKRELRAFSAREKS